MACWIIAPVVDLSWDGRCSVRIKVEFDAFYQYGEIGDNAYHCVVLGTEKPSFVRRQFSAAHELGHIVLHEKFNDLDEVSREDFRKREDEANEFAAEFLLPKAAFLNDLKMYPNKLTHYIDNNGRRLPL